MLGLDLSKIETSYAIYDTESKTFDTYGKISTKKIKDDMDKINYICDFISGLIKGYKVDVIVSEYTTSTPSMEYTIVLHELIGALFRIARDNHIPYSYKNKKGFWINKVCGRGNFTKLEGIRVIAKKYINIGNVIHRGSKRNEGIYVAIGIAIGKAIT